MCKLSLMLGTLLLGLTGCGADTGGNLPAYDSGGSGDAASGGSSSAGRGLANETTGGNSSSGSYCPACPVCETNPAPKCVVGAQSACTCTDGSSGAQVCQDDGTMGACECDVTSPTQTEECALVYISQDSLSCRFNSMRIRVNCSIATAASLGIQNCEAPAPGGPLSSLNGVVCCF